MIAANLKFGREAVVALSHLQGEDDLALSAGMERMLRGHGKLA